MTIEIMFLVGLLIVAVFCSTAYVAVTLTEFFKLLLKEKRKTAYLEKQIKEFCSKQEEAKKIVTVTNKEALPQTDLMSTKALLDELKSRSGALLAISVGRGSALEKDIHCVVSAEKFELTTLFTAAQELMYRAVREKNDEDMEA